MSGTRRASRTTAAGCRRNRVALLLAAAGLVACQAAAAAAASFTVNPTQIFLSATTRTALLTLKNETDQPIRFQLAATGWTQDPAGRMVLEPTEDVVVFPALLALGAREERKVRVGVTVAPAALERAYRVFVEELPPLDDVNPVAGVAMRTKMGIPVFIEPTRVVVEARVEGVTLEGDRLSFRLLNTGTRHFTPDAVRVRGLDAAGLAVTELPIDAWYVLAGGRRDFEVSVPPARCGDIRSFTVEAQVPGRTLKETLPAPDGACAKRR